MSRPGDVVSDTRTVYDNPALAQQWRNRPASPGPKPRPPPGTRRSCRTPTATATARSRIRPPRPASTTSYGCPTATYDANGNKTSTAYAMNGGVTTGTTITNPLGQPTTATLIQLPDPLSKPMSQVVLGHRCGRRLSDQCTAGRGEMIEDLVARPSRRAYHHHDHDRQHHAAAQSPGPPGPAGSRWIVGWPWSGRPGMRPCCGPWPTPVARVGALTHRVLTAVMVRRSLIMRREQGLAGYRRQRNC